MVKIKDLIKLVLLTIFFSIVLFIINYIFFTSQKEAIEDKYIEPVIKKQNEETLKIKVNPLNDVYKQDNISDNVEEKFYFVFIPSNFREKIKHILKNTITILHANTFYEKINKLKLEFYEEENDVRWKMKSRTIKLFWIQDMWDKETLTVFIHEAAHFVDLYFLEKTVSLDISNKFYDISWKSTKVIRDWQLPSSFVSGYAMTNKYEDFAESFTYFILHNSDFLEKTKESKILKQKYDFFMNYLFKKKEFFKTDFGNWEKIKSYYWDITKIDINLENFLQYIEKQI